MTKNLLIALLVLAVVALGYRKQLVERSEAASANSSEATDTIKCRSLTAQVINVRSIAIVDKDGNPRIVGAVAEDGEAVLTFNARKQSILMISQSADGECSIQMHSGDRMVRLGQKDKGTALVLSQGKNELSLNASATYSGVSAQNEKYKMVFSGGAAPAGYRPCIVITKEGKMIWGEPPWSSIENPSESQGTP